MGVTPSTVVARLSDCLAAYGLPTTVTELCTLAGCLAPLSAAAIVAATATDKKNASATSSSSSSSSAAPTSKLSPSSVPPLSHEAPDIQCVLLSEIGTVAKQRGRYTHTVDPTVLTRLMSPAVVVRRGSLPLPPHVTVTVPGSKSISNRTLLLAALCRQPVAIDGLLLSDDTQVRRCGCVCRLRT